MQCPKCKYEPTMAEMQRSPSSCIKCATSYSGYQQATSIAKAGNIVAVVVGVVLLLGVAVFGWQWNEERQEKELLFSQVDQQVRVFNGLVGELLDQSAGMTRGQFFEKANRRVIDIDAAIAKALSIDDSVMPGLGKQAAAYGKASRSMIKAIGEQQRAEVGLSVAKAGHAVYAKYESDKNFQLLLSRSEEQLRVERENSLSAVEAEQDLSKKVALLKNAADIGDVHGLRVKYLQSKGEVDTAAGILASAQRDLSAAVKRLDLEGKRLNEISGNQFPIEKWSVN